MGTSIPIEIAYATPQKQLILERRIPADTPPREAIAGSGIVDEFPEIDVMNCDIGVFGKAIADDYRLCPGDRIEIYRPLIADPKEVRRQRARRGLKTKKGGGTLTTG